MVTFMSLSSIDDCVLCQPAGQGCGIAHCSVVLIDIFKMSNVYGSAARYWAIVHELLFEYTIH